MTDDNTQRSVHFKQLRWSLQGLAMAGSEQGTLFPESVESAGELASDYDHWASVVRCNYETDLSQAQTESLAAIDRKLETMSRDGAEFDAELWTDAALTSSQHWADVRSLAAGALEAFGWPVECPPLNSGDRGTLIADS
jgi:hypothetical protein